MENESNLIQKVVINEASETVAVENPQTSIPSMEEYKDEINRSLKRIREDDMLTGTIIDVSDKGVTLDLGIYAEGIIPVEEYSNDPTFSVMTDVVIGQVVNAIVTRLDDGNGCILLSKKRADNILAWGTLTNLLKQKTVIQIKITDAVNAGVVGYLEGIRAFIPASQITRNYVEDLSSWVGKTVEAVVITVEEDKNKLVLSAKEVEREKALADHSSKIAQLKKGVVSIGIVEKITSYGAFVNIGDGISGLVHISEMSYKRIQSPKEILSEGQEVHVKILDTKDGKVSLSIKAVSDREEIIENATDEALGEYIFDGEVSTGLGDLLAKLNLKQ